MENNQNNKSGCNIIILDYILIIGMIGNISFNFLSGKMHIVFIILIAVAFVAFMVILIRFLEFLVRTRIVGNIVKLILGIGLVLAIYIIIENNTGGSIGDSGNGKGVMSKLLESNPIWWWSIVILVSLISIGLHFASVETPSHKKSAQSISHNQRLFNPNDMLEDVDVLTEDFAPYNSDNRASPNVQTMFDAFNSAQKLYENVLEMTDEVVDELQIEYYPEELVEVVQNLRNAYNALESRMKAYTELFNESDNSCSQEFIEDIVEKSNHVNECVARLDSALKLLKQTVQTQADNSGVSFFQGCDTAEKLNKRYKSLTKAYHPDLDVGDEETMKQINAEYDKLKANFSSKGKS